MWTGVHRFHEGYLTRPSGLNDGAIVKSRFTTADKSLEGDNTVPWPARGKKKKEGDERETFQSL